VDLGIGLAGIALPEGASSVAGALQTGRVARKLFKVGDTASDAYKAYKLVKLAKSAKDIAVGMHAMQQTFGKSAAGDSLRALTEEGVDFDLAHKFSDREGKMEGLIEGIMSPLALVSGGVGAVGLAGSKTLMRGIFKKASRAAMLKAMAGAAYAQQTEQVEEGLQGYSSSAFRSAAHEAQVMRGYEQGLVENLEKEMADPKNKIKKHFQLVEDGYSQYKEAFWSTLGFGIFGGVAQAPSTIGDIQAGRQIDAMDATQGERQEAIQTGAGDVQAELGALKETVMTREEINKLQELYAEMGVAPEVAQKRIDAIQGSKSAQEAVGGAQELQGKIEARQGKQADIKAEADDVAKMRKAVPELYKNRQRNPDAWAEAVDFLGKEEITRVLAEGPLTIEKLAGQPSDIKAVGGEVKKAVETQQGEEAVRSSISVEEINALNEQIDPLVNQLIQEKAQKDSQGQLQLTEGETGEVAPTLAGALEQQQQVIDVKSVAESLLPNASAEERVGVQEAMTQLIEAEDFEGLRSFLKEASQIGLEQQKQTIEGELAPEQLTAPETTALEAQEDVSEVVQADLEGQPISEAGAEQKEALTTPEEPVAYKTIKEAMATEGVKRDQIEGERGAWTVKQAEVAEVDAETTSLDAEVAPTEESIPDQETETAPKSKAELEKELADALEETAKPEDAPVQSKEKQEQEKKLAEAFEKEPQFRDKEAGQAWTKATEQQQKNVSKLLSKSLGSRITVKMVDRIFEQGKERLGKYQDSLISLANNGDIETTAAHEAVHAAEEMFLTDRELERIKALEPDAEKRAEGIIAFINNKPSGLSANMKRYLRKIKTFLKGLFGAKRGEVQTIDQMYDMLLEGELKKGEIQERVSEEAKFRTEEAKPEAKPEKKEKPPIAIADARVFLQKNGIANPRAEWRKSGSDVGYPEWARAKVAEIKADKKVAKKAKSEFSDEMKEYAGDLGVEIGLDEEGKRIKSEKVFASGDDISTTVSTSKAMKNITKKIWSKTRGLVTSSNLWKQFGPEAEQAQVKREGKIGGGINRDFTKYTAQLATKPENIEARLKDNITIDEMKDKDGNTKKTSMKFGEAVYVYMQLMNAKFKGEMDEDGKPLDKSNPLGNIVANGLTYMSNAGKALRTVTEPSQRDAILKGMDADVKAEAKRISKIMDEVYAEVAPVWKRMTGKTLEHREFYAHIMRDMSQDAGTASESRTGETASNGLMDLVLQKDASKVSNLEQLTGGTGAPYKLADVYGVSQNAMKSTIDYKHMAPYIKGMEQLLTDENFKRQAVERFRGDSDMADAWIKQSLDNVRSLGGLSENTDATSKALSKLSRKITNNMAKSFMASPFLAMKQFASIGNMATFFGGDVWAKGMATPMSKAEKKKFMEAGYGIALHRGETGGLVNTFVDESQTTKGKVKQLQDKAMFMTRAVDKKTTSMAVNMAKVKVDQTWKGAKDESYYKAVGEMADEAIISTQISTSDLGRTAMQRNRSGFMAPLTFMRGARSISLSAILSSGEAWGNSVWRLNNANKNNASAEEVAKLEKEAKDARSTFFAQARYHGLMQGAIIEGINKGKWGALGLLATGMAGGEDPDKEPFKEQLMSSLLNIGSNVAGLAPFGEELATLGRFAAGDKKSTYKALTMEDRFIPALQIPLEGKDQLMRRKKINRYEKELRTKRDAEGNRITTKGLKRMRTNMATQRVKEVDTYMGMFAKLFGVPFAGDVLSTKRRVQRRKEDIKKAKKGKR